MNTTFFNNPSHTSQVFSTSPQSSPSSGHVFTTEIYPPSFLPSSSQSSPMESPILLPIRPSSFSNVNDHLFFTTEIYPSSFLPSSSESSPMESPILLPRRPSSLSNVNDHFTLDGNGNNNNSLREIVFTLPSNHNQRTVKRKGSKASIKSNRNSVLLDPIVEETNDSSLMNRNADSSVIDKH